MNVRAVAVLVLGSLCAGCSSGSSGPDGSYDPVVLGRSHAYAMSTAGGAPTAYRTQIVATSASGRYTRRTTTAGIGGSVEHELVVLGGSEYEATRIVRGSDGSAYATTSFTPAFLLLSEDDTPGSTETTVSTVTGGAATYEYTRTVTVDGVETVTVPAGTFSALRTTAHLTDTSGWDAYNVNWWVRGIGRVKIVSYGASSPGAGTTYELTDYGDAAVP